MAIFTGTVHFHTADDAPKLSSPRLHHLAAATFLENELIDHIQGQAVGAIRAEITEDNTHGSPVRFSVAGTPVEVIAALQLHKKT
ncbi:hypothetical protein GS891_25505, partial [Rhodococcus hoagii]|nr:hypothetical protein [Prescottella equi]